MKSHTIFEENSVFQCTNVYNVKIILINFAKLKMSKFQKDRKGLETFKLYKNKGLKISLHAAPWSEKNEKFH